MAKVKNVRNTGDWERPERERGTVWRNAGDWERPEQEKGMAWLREIGTVRERGTVWLLGRVKMWRRYSVEIVFSNLGFHFKKITEIVFATIEFHLGYFFFFTSWNSSLCFFKKKKKKKIFISDLCWSELEPKSWILGRNSSLANSSSKISPTN